MVFYAERKEACMRGGYIEDIRVAYYRDDIPESQLEKPTDVKIRVRACGICGSEVHAYLGGTSVPYSASGIGP